MMSIPPKPPPLPLSHKAVFSEQGCLVSGLWWITYLLTFVSLQHWLSRLAHRLDGSLYDEDRRKPTPWWQDVELLVVVVAAILGFWLSFQSQPGIRRAAFALLLLTILDLVNYHARVLWFDDLRPARPDSSPYVWSHRRIVFHAAISLAASVVIFAGFYTFKSDFAGCSATDLLRYSFRTSFALDLRPNYDLLDATQLATSVLFLVVVLATMSSSAYKRRELAPPPEERCEQPGT